MTVDTLYEKFVYHLEEMYYVENQLVDTLDQLAVEVNNEELREGFAEHRDQTREHANRLEEIFRSIDEEPTERQSPVFDALVEERRQFFDEATDDDLRDLYDLNAGVKTEHVEIAGYESLIQLARKLDMPKDVTSRLDQNLDEEEQTKKQLKAFTEDSAIRRLFARLTG